MSFSTPQQEKNRFFSLPGWVVSFAVHAGLLLLFTVSMKSCSNGTEGAGEGEMREIGIYLKTKNEFNQPDPTETNTQQQSENKHQSSTPSRFTGTEVSDVVDPNPPVPISFPGVSPSKILGPGMAVPAFPDGSNTGNVNSNGFTKPAGGSTGGGRPGETSFIGLHDKGKSFVLLIDCSGSMANHSALQVAKAEVKATLEALKSDQKFQIIFFNERFYQLHLKGDKSSQLYFATDINKTLANQFISGIHASLGTERTSAIRRGLSLKADVIFLLTDADNPPSSRKLAEIQQLNKSRTRIHCIEFGKGSQLNLDNYLKKIARQNKDSYGYRNVMKFDR